MDFVYICRDGDNEELRYSIRSVINSFPEARVWVVGGKPKWYVGNYIEVDQSSLKYINAINNLNSLCDSKEISDDFILMNDDFFILKQIDKIEYLHGGLLSNKIDRFKQLSRGSAYIKKLVETEKTLEQCGIQDPLDYELHVPMVMNKEKLKAIIEANQNCLWRSLYGNIFKVAGKETVDVKIYHSNANKSISYKITNDSIYVSTDDITFNELWSTTLKRSFPHKSIYEV
jgi:hypothetical protein